MTTRIKLRRDTAANWMDVNPVLALAEPGVETDTNKMKVGDGTKAWNDLQYIDGADVSRIKAGWIQPVGYLPEIGNGEGDDFWFQSVAVDSDNNSYYVGGNYVNNTPWTVKLDPNGEVLWQKELGPFDAQAGEGQAVQIDPTNGEVVIVADMWNFGGLNGNSAWAGMILYRLNPVDGSVVGNPLRIRDDQSENSIDVYPYDLLVDSDGSTVIIGYRNDDISRTDVTKQTGSAGQSIIINADAVEQGIYPQAYNDWYVSGTDINGDGLVTAVNYYQNANATGGGGNGATFDFGFYVYKGQPQPTVSINQTGSGYAVNDTLTVSSLDCGASTNVTITVTGIDGNGGVAAFSNTYTPDLTKIKLTIDPNGGSVDFSNSGTWQLVEYKRDSGFIRSTQNGGWTATVGDTDNDTFYVGAIDSAGNVYAGGRTYDNDFDGGRDRNMLVKFNSSGVVQYKKSFDYVGTEGDTGYTGLVTDSNDNVYIAGGINEYNTSGNNLQTITKLDSSGNILWQKKNLNGMFSIWNLCLDVDSDDNLYVGAEISSYMSRNDDFYFAKFDPNGNLVWQRSLRSYGDENSQWGNGYQSLKVQGDRIYYCGSTLVYSYNDNNAALAISLATDGSGLGTIANGVWDYVDVNYINWENTSDQQSTVLQVGVTDSVFTTDEPVTGSTDTPYTTSLLNIYTGEGGQVGVVKELTFEDGTVQTTASKPIIPQAIEGTLHGANQNLYLRLDHAGQFIRVNFYNGNQYIYVPTNADVPFEVGTVITIIADEIFSNSDHIRLYAENTGVTQITGVGYNNTNNYPYWWDLNRNGNNNKTGVYTLMKVDIDRWIIAGPDVAENWC